MVGGQCPENAAARISSVTSKGEQFVRRIWSSWVSSAGRQALEGADLAPGSIPTRQELSNPQRRPPREPLPADLLTFQPASTFELDERKLS